MRKQMVRGSAILGLLGVAAAGALYALRVVFRGAW